ncbi:MAG TPA: hypothetical protein P5561_00120 [Candidatus Omnitrophota bacterium]|jgi:hypothetical protein|nr:hypothetical protein [Candidatus Omnitrophota bacterium]HRY84919.1 hypothetical protein [Candidatus Omnitrophota bacterium]
MTSPTPKANAMLICDYVITERGTNKKSLIGVFENIGAATFPCTHFAMSVYIKLTDAQGGYSFRLELVDLQSDMLIGKSEMPEEVRVPSPLDAHELVFNLRGVRFMHPGKYEFRIFANDKIFGQKRLVVEQVDANRPPEDK